MAEEAAQIGEDAEDEGWVNFLQLGVLHPRGQKQGITAHHQCHHLCATVCVVLVYRMVAVLPAGALAVPSVWPLGRSGGDSSCYNFTNRI